MTSAVADDDRTLATAVARNGDERAFGALYDRHTPALYRLALRLVGGEASDAEDIVHDAWVRAVGRLAGFEWRSALRTWLCGIVVNRARELLRQRHQLHWTTHADAVAADDVRLSGTFDRLELERAIAALPAGARAVLVLHDVEGYTHEEIGRLLDIEPGTSKSQLSRARRDMRRALERPEGSRT
ncbi:MAG: RNA polymerase sigma factor [Gemmatimonadales bacterium]